MSDQLRQQNINALLDERRGYQARLIGAEGDAKAALSERVAAVNAALKGLGYQEPKAQSVERPAENFKQAPARNSR